MKKLAVLAVIAAELLFGQAAADAQYRTKKAADDARKTEAELILEQADSSDAPVVITLEQALEIALSENLSVKVADMEIERTGFAKKGTYASLFPQIDVSGTYQRTIKKQVMYMDLTWDRWADPEPEATARAVREKFPATARQQVPVPVKALPAHRREVVLRSVDGTHGQPVSRLRCLL